MPNEVGPPIEAPEGILFTLKDVAYTPEAPRMNEPFIVKGKVELLSIPFLAPVWVIVTVEYPETWWEEIIPIIGAPQVRQSDLALGGNFEVTFEEGFVREGDFKLTTRLYGGPTMPIDKLTLPPFPPVATDEKTFTVSGEVPPAEKVWEMVEEVPDIVIKLGPPVAVWEMVEEITGIIIKTGAPVAVWEMVEEVAGIIIRPVAPVAAWEMVEEISGIVIRPKAAPPVGMGTFTVYLRGEPISYKEFCVEWETAEGALYIGTWATYYLIIKEGSYVSGPYDGDIPLIGRVSAWLWDGTTSHKYGPSAYHTLKDGGEYTFDLSDLKLYQK